MSKLKMIPTLGLSDAISLASRKLTDFSGRSRRSEFWYWMLLVILLNIIVSQVFSFNAWVVFFAEALVMLLGLSVTARRLQDTGKSAVWVYVSYALGLLSNGYVAASGIQEMFQKYAGDPDGMARMMEKQMDGFAAMSLLSLLFAIVAIIVIVFCCMDSTPGANKYGASPKYVAEE